jgi:hypothetical protein
MQWIDNIADKEQLADGGNHLSRSGKVLKKNGIVDEPYQAGQESLAGYIIIFAENMDEATSIAQKCPILKGDLTSVEIREID